MEEARYLEVANYELGAHSRGIGAKPHALPSRVQQTHTESAVLVRCMYSGLVGGAAVCTSCSVVGLRWWAGVFCACVPSVASSSSFRLPGHA